MPESPEVDALAGFLRARATGRTIRAIELEEFRVLKTRNRRTEELADRTVIGVRRFGKHVSLDTDGPGLLISFGRAGWARWADAGEAETVPDASDAVVAPVVARITFTDGAEMALTDAGDWLSLGISIADDVTTLPAVADLGPDPTTPAFTPELLDGLVRGRRKQLKALLQEQASLAGIGNAYSDEILHAARLSPTTHASALDADQRERLFVAITGVLTAAFDARRDVPIDQQKAAKVASMRVHGRTGEPCPVCGDLVLDVPGSKGAAQYCPTCQNGGRPLEP
ncbi:formamidopyrimidine-DNA glycosylase [Diaminobutyricimonas aerilata]|uniref:Formamidopyrimidine-DNA glycosylase n=1 Tax=Diaminobutyricimonas aerilata TaxID=1162967 RepID=A0A2M9CNJ9_9MICO|nr:DNA-formamidopyrimidine glycosylase family protein [Diaminobutyricimonas aerilata]PJJ73479.1 formamidopyrimidine-DNA glycosylase [Diaminobutyricimonas aerilata]